MEVAIECLWQIVVYDGLDVFEIESSGNTEFCFFWMLLILMFFASVLVWLSDFLLHLEIVNHKKHRISMLVEILQERQKCDCPDKRRPNGLRQIPVSFSSLHG